MTQLLEKAFAEALKLPELECTTGYTYLIIYHVTADLS